MDDPAVTDLLDGFGCMRSRALYVPGGLNPGSDGYECRSAGIGLSFDTDLRVTGIGLRDEGVLGFSRFEGTLPFDLHFGDDRTAVESRLDEELGYPVTRVAPGGYDFEIDPVFSDAYAVDGGTFRGLHLEFTPDTEELRAVIVGVDEPWCISSCFDPGAPSTSVDPSCFVDCEEELDVQDE